VNTRSTAAIIDSIRIRRRSGLSIGRGRRVFRNFWLQRSRRRFLFDGGIGWRWYVGAVCERIVYRSELGELETAIRFAVGRHCMSLVDPSSELL